MSNKVSRAFSKVINLVVAATAQGASKGELGFFVYSDGSAKPYRLHVRGPSFNNLYAISQMSRGGMLSDIVTNIGSIDIVLGEVDR